MSFEKFKQLVVDWAQPLGIRVRFNKTNGRYYGNCSDGNTIIGNSISGAICLKTFNGRTYNWRVA